MLSVGARMDTVKPTKTTVARIVTSVDSVAKHQHEEEEGDRRGFCILHALIQPSWILF